MLGCFFRSIDIVYCFIIGLVNSIDIVLFNCGKKKRTKKAKKKSRLVHRVGSVSEISSHLIFAKVILLDLYEVTSSRWTVVILNSKA